MSRRFRRRPSRATTVALMLAAVLAVRFGYDRLQPPGNSPTDQLLREGPCRVVRVVDGDTLIVRQAAAPSSDSTGGDRREMRVRLLGVDTPETVKPNHPIETWGPEATAFTQSFLTEGQVRLRLDRRRIDRYGRLLAYVYVDDALLNEALVRAGMARVSVYPGDSPTMTRILRDAQQEAQAAGRGIWSQKP